MRGIDGDRSSLYAYIVQAVARVKPKVFIAENVGGLLLKRNERSLQTILDDFGSLGYNISYRNYNAAEYGVPQTRNRVFIVGTHAELPAFTPPEPTHPIPVTAKDAIGDLSGRERDEAFSIFGAWQVPAGSKATEDCSPTVQATQSAPSVMATSNSIMSCLDGYQCVRLPVYSLSLTLLSFHVSLGKQRDR
jgi:site-specific DNA-cytosine methylase